MSDADSATEIENRRIDFAADRARLQKILTGQPIWRLEEAGNIHSTLPAKFATYTELLEKAGYAVGYTGKGWSPGRLEAGGRKSNPVEKPFNRQWIVEEIRYGFV